MQLIDGTNIANQILSEIDEPVYKIGVILASNDESSRMYVTMKQKKAAQVGIEMIIKEYDESVSDEEVIYQIQNWNNDASIGGILVQLPLFDTLNTIEVLNTIHPKKDIDGLTAIQQGRVAQLHKDSFIPATVEAILESINATTPENVTWKDINGDGFNLDKNYYTGKNVTIINNSNLIGIPLANVLSKCNATVTIANIHTKNLKDITLQSDIVVTATGQTEVFDSTFFKKGASVIDVTSVKKDGKVMGDVIVTDELEGVLGWLTPVPGGIGPLTIACLLRNVDY